jgi:hypothetical protein
MRTITTAEVRLTVIVHISDSWGGECRMDQVHQQAAEAAVHAVRRSFRSQSELEVLGEPEVVATTIEQKSNA